MNGTSILILVVSGISVLAIVALFIYAVIKSKRQNKLENQTQEGGIDDELIYDETSMIHLTQTRMKIHHASSIRPIRKNYLRMKLPESMLL
jgi:hypothetical protein